MARLSLVRERSPAARDDLTPNQLDKRRQIIEAARQVLASQGLAGCTAREVAAAGPLTKSAIHYYFADMDVLIDQAMAAHVAAFEAQLRAAGDAAADPPGRFWAAVDAYLDTFRDRPSVAHLWFEYWIDAARKKRTDPVAQMQQRVARLFAERLEAAGATAPGERGRTVLVYLMGAIVEQAVEPRPRRQVRADVSALAGLAPPRELAVSPCEDGTSSVAEAELTRAACAGAGVLRWGTSAASARAPTRGRNRTSARRGTSPRCRPCGSAQSRRRA